MKFEIKIARLRDERFDVSKVLMLRLIQCEAQMSIT